MQRLSAELFIYYLDDKNPLEEYLKRNFKELNDLKFLIRDETERNFFN